MFCCSSLLGLLLATTLWCSPAHADPVAQLARILSRAPDYKQRLVAVLGLARLRDPRAVPALIKALADPHHTVRGAAASALGAVGDQRARPPLEALLLRAKNDYVRGQTQGALAALMARAGHAREAKGRMQVHGTLGVLDQQSIQEGINARLDQASSCLGQQLNSEPYLGGKVELKFRVSTDGKVKWLRLRRSDLGSTEVEQCITREMAAATFDAPDGGEAEFSIPLTFGGGEPTATLDPERSAAARRLRQSCARLLRAVKRDRLRAPAALMVTLYLDAAGTVRSVGLSAGDEEIPEEFTRRFVANLKQLKLEDPAVTGAYGKLTYRFTCDPR